MHGVVHLGLAILGLWMVIAMLDALRTGRIPMGRPPVDRRARPIAYWLTVVLVLALGLLLVGMALRRPISMYLGLMH